MHILASVAFVLFLSFCLGSIFALVVGFVLWRKISGYLETKREKELVAMRRYHKRLSTIVAELLSKANEIDQESQYVQSVVTADWLGFPPFGRQRSRAEPL
ncbi:MAG TPA: hypothetical protein V6D17_08535 [Candidatus Obscuribacterales bacterium]